MKNFKDIFYFILMFWIFGGGLILALLGLVISWKLTLIIFCAWVCSVIFALIWVSSE